MAPWLAGQACRAPGEGQGRLHILYIVPLNYMDGSTVLLLMAGFPSLIAGGELLVRGASRLAASAGVPPLRAIRAGCQWRRGSAAVCQWVGVREQQERGEQDGHPEHQAARGPGA